MNDTDRLNYLIATGDTARLRGKYWIVDDALARFTSTRQFATARNAIDDAILNRWPSHWANPEAKESQ